MDRNLTAVVFGFCTFPTRTRPNMIRGMALQSAAPETPSAFDADLLKELDRVGRAITATEKALTPSLWAAARKTPAVTKIVMETVKALGTLHHERDELERRTELTSPPDTRLQGAIPPTIWRNGRLDELDSEIASLRSQQASFSQRDPQRARALGEACVLLEDERLTALWELVV